MPAKHLLSGNLKVVETSSEKVSTQVMSDEVFEVLLTYPASEYNVAASTFGKPEDHKTCIFFASWTQNK